MHRADLQKVMLEAVKLRGVTLRLGCVVVTVHDTNSRLAVEIEGSESIEADVVVGADGKQGSCYSLLREDSQILKTRPRELSANLRMIRNRFCCQK